MTKPKNIEVIAYDPRWREQFAVEAEFIQKVLGDLCIAVHHVGSTAIEGLAAKPSALSQKFLE